VPGLFPKQPQGLNKKSAFFKALFLTIFISKSLGQYIFGRVVVVGENRIRGEIYRGSIYKGISMGGCVKLSRRIGVDTHNKDVLDRVRPGGVQGKNPGLGKNISKCF